jgi:SpoIIAA-like
MAKMSMEVDPADGIARITVDGVATVADLDAFNEEAKRKLKAFGGRPFGVLVDLRRMKPGSPESTEKVKEHQAILMKAGVKKSAEVVESAAAALQLNRIARESGLLSMVQRFTEVDTALAWLRERD